MRAANQPTKYPSKVRRQIAFEAAQLMYRRQESEYYRAKMKAGRRICRGWVKPLDLPSNAEIRDQIQVLARTLEGPARQDHLCDMRVDALRMMRLLHRFRPRLIGSVLTGHIRRGSDIDLHVFSDSVEAVATTLEWEGLSFGRQRKEVRKHGETRVYNHIHIADRYAFELTIYPLDRVGFVFKSSITGKAMERASIAELEHLLRQEYPELDVDAAVVAADDKADRFQVYHSLLLPLEPIQENPRYHPESDALYHSLQVFDLARDALPYDEDFLLAALLHDVGKAIDRDEHVAAALEALEGFISPRTAWLIEHHMAAHELRKGTLGLRARRRLAHNESYDELMLLARCDAQGRCQGVEVPSVDEALEYLRDLSRLGEV